MTQLIVHGIATGGEGVARDDNGRTVFIRGALPGEVVEVDIDSEHKRFARGSIKRLIEGAPGRQEPFCDHIADGCGGCDLQYATAELQQELKTRIAIDCLERIGRIESPEVSFGGAVPSQAYRTTIRASLVGGRAGFHEFHSHDVVATPRCLVAHPRLCNIMAEGRFGPAASLQLRVGARTGDCSVVVAPGAVGVSIPDGDLVGLDEVKAGRASTITERVHDRVLQVSARSFFQSSPEAAELLVTAVQAEMTAGPTSGTLVDLYSGVGLIVGSVDFNGRRIAVEQNASAVADARLNLSDLDVDVIHSSVEKWKPVPADVVVADPVRTGLDKVGVQRVTATSAEVVVLVSCDPGALGRDAKLLAEAGYRFVQASVLDVFPQTSHVEVVSRFTRSKT